MKTVTAAMDAIEMAMVVAQQNQSDRYAELEYGLNILRAYESSGTGSSLFATDGRKGVALKPTPAVLWHGSEITQKENQ